MALNILLINKMYKPLDNTKKYVLPRGCIFMNKLKYLYDYLYIVLGSFVLSVAINFFLLPCKLSTGGVSGLATVFYYVFKIPLSVTNIIVNLILFVLGFKILPKHQLLKTLAGVVFLSLFLELGSQANFAITDIFIASVFGGVLIGLGVSLTVLKGASTGGTDFAAIMVHKNLNYISVAGIMLVIDFVVILISGVVFKNFVITFYSIVSLYIAAKVADFLLVRGDFAKCVYIITQKHNQISSFIQNKMNRGVTGIYVKGLYSFSNTFMLMCILRSKEIPKLIDGVKQIDANAFTIISEVRRVHGKGFNDYNL